MDRRARAGLAALAVAASALAWSGAGPYPLHDVRPLVAEMEGQPDPGDAALVYSATRWAYGLYTGFGVTFRDDPTRGTGFDVVLTDPWVHILEPQRAAPGRYDPTSPRAPRGPNGCGCSPAGGETTWSCSSA